MEETVIWEQHTVTLHRVSVLNCFLLFPSLLLSLFSKLLHISPILKMSWDHVCLCVCVFSTSYILSLFIICPSCSPALSGPAVRRQQDVQQ